MHAGRRSRPLHSTRLEAHHLKEEPSMGAVVPLVAFAARVAALRIAAAAVAIVVARAGAVVTVDIGTVGAHVGAHVGASCCLAHS